MGSNPVGGRGMSEAGLFDNSSLPPELEARVRAELSGGEQLLWVGQPRPSRFARQGIPLVLFGIPWTAFALFWMGCASMPLLGWAGGGRNLAPGGGPGAWFGGFFACFPLFGVPFVLIGLWMLTSPYWLRRKAKRTFYALTDRRAILWEPGWFGSGEVRSYGPNQLTKTIRKDLSDGGGDLVFEEIVTVNRNSDGPTTSTTRHGFMGIDNVRGVEELLRKALLSNPPR